MPWGYFKWSALLSGQKMSSYFAMKVYGWWDMGKLTRPIFRYFEHIFCAYLRIFWPCFQNIPPLPYQRLFLDLLLAKEYINGGSRPDFQLVWTGNKKKITLTVWTGTKVHVKRCQPAWNLCEPLWNETIFLCVLCLIFFELVWTGRKKLCQPLTESLGLPPRNGTWIASWSWRSTSF